MVGNLLESEIDELRAVPYQRKAIALPNRSVAVVWSDKNHAIHLTVHTESSTLEEAVLEGVGVGRENGS